MTQQSGNRPRYREPRLWRDIIDNVNKRPKFHYTLRQIVSSHIYIYIHVKTRLFPLRRTCPTAKRRGLCGPVASIAGCVACLGLPTCPSPGSPSGQWTYRMHPPLPLLLLVGWTFATPEEERKKAANVPVTKPKLCEWQSHKRASW